MGGGGGSLSSAHPSEQACERLLELCVILSGSIIQTFILSKESRICHIVAVAELPPRVLNGESGKRD